MTSHFEQPNHGREIFTIRDLAPVTFNRGGCVTGKASQPPFLVILTSTISLPTTETLTKHVNVPHKSPNCSIWVDFNEQEILRSFIGTRQWRFFLTGAVRGMAGHGAPRSPPKAWHLSTAKIENLPLANGFILSDVSPCIKLSQFVFRQKVECLLSESFTCVVLLNPLVALLLSTGCVTEVAKSFRACTHRRQD